MTLYRILVACCLVLSASGAPAAAFESELFALDVPGGFQGPISQSMGADGSVIAFTKPHPGAPTNTLLQITIYSAPAGAQPPRADQLGPLSERYLGQFLGGIERRRTDFSSTKPSRVTLGGLPATKVTWTGVAQGRQMRGTMYCVIVGTRVFSLHVQDFESAPPNYLREAEAALTSIRFKSGG